MCKYSEPRFFMMSEQLPMTLFLFLPVFTMYYGISVLFRSTTEPRDMFPSITCSNLALLTLCKR